SFIMKNIIDEINKNNTTSGNNCRFKIILPIKIDDSYDPNSKEAGLFPDRLIAKVEEFGKKGVNEIHKEFLVIIDNANDKINKDYIKEFKTIVEESINQYSLAIELKEDNNPLEVIYPLLDSMDQQSSFNTEIGVNNIRKYIETVNTTQLFTGIFGEKYRFRSVPEIATYGVSEKGKRNIYINFFEKLNEDEKDLYKSLNEILNSNDNPSELKNYHKYMAVVQADGDDLGRLFKVMFEYGGIEAIKTLSGFLMRFGMLAASEIRDYGGVPIYLGGDDILFFAPLKTSEEEGPNNIFELITSLDNIFKKCICECQLVLESIDWWNKKAQTEYKIATISTPSLSFGCAISYYKYPLKEALISARTLLFESAKQIPGKNALSYRLLKHSGHYIGTTLCKNWESWDSFKYLLNNQSLNDEFLSSVQYKLEPLRPLLKRILCGRNSGLRNATLREIIIAIIPEESLRENFLINLSEKFFNEKAAHDKSRKYIEYVLSLLLQIYRDMEDNYGNIQSTADMAIDSLYAYLRTMQFYISKY
ncbi:MAG: hypothetical protein Q8R90_09275, partial [Bacteroidales bacterium]|nr:hypothetical protein [Bacteroidales bacterium]